MSRNTELVKNTAILTIGKICTQFISFFLLPLYTAVLSPDEYGTADLVTTYVALLIPLCNWQLENGLFRFMIDARGDTNRQKQLFSTVFLTNIGQSVLFLAIFAVVQFWIDPTYKIFLAAGVVLSLLLNSLMQFARGLGHNAAYSFASFISATATVVLNVLLIVVFPLGMYGLLLSTVLAKAITILYLCLSQKVWRFLSFSAFEKETFKNVTKYSWPLVPNELSWWGVSASNRVIITYALGAAANGLFSVANKFSNIFITFFNIFVLSWTETVALHVSDEDSETYLSELTNTMFRLFSALCIGIIACMPFVFPLLVNEQYGEAYNQIPILLIGLLFQIITGLYGAFYVALKKSAELAKSTLAAAAINVICTALGVKLVGLYAASLAVLIAYATIGIYRLFHIRHLMKISLDSKAVFITFLVGGVTVVAYYYNNFIIQVLILLLVMIYAVLINRKVLLSVLDALRRKR